MSLRRHSTENPARRLFRRLSLRFSSIGSSIDLPYTKRPEPGKCLLSDADNQSERAPEVTLHTNSNVSPRNHRHQKFLVPDVLPKGSDCSHGDVNRNGGDYVSNDSHVNRQLEEGSHTLPKRYSFRKPRPAPPPPPKSDETRSSTPKLNIGPSGTGMFSSPNYKGSIQSISVVPLATSTPSREDVFRPTVTSRQNIKQEHFATPTKPGRRKKRSSNSGITESSSSSSVRSSPPTLPRRPPPKPPRSFTYKRASRASGSETTFLADMPTIDMSIGSYLEHSDHMEIYENLSFAMRSKRLWQVLSITKDLLIDRLDPQIIMCRLSERRLITMDEENQVYSRLNKMAMNQAVLDALLGKGDDDFDEFCACLREDECHHALADVLDVVNEIFKIVAGAKHYEGTLKLGEGVVLLGNNINCDVSYFDRVTGRKRPVTELDDTKSMLSVTFESSLDEMCSSPSFSIGSDRLMPIITVDIFEQKLYGEQISALADLLKKHVLISEFSIAKGGLDSATTSILSEVLEYNDSLLKLDIRLNPTSNDGVHYIAKALKSNSTLKSLNLSHTSLVSGAAHELLDMLISNEVLEDLDLSFNELDDKDCKFLARAIEGNRCLHSLRARCNAISAPGCRDIFKALCFNKHLVILDISSNDIGDDGAAALSVSLPKVQGLKELNLEKCKIGASGAVKIADGLQRNNCIENLDFSMNSICDEGACAFANMLLVNSSLVSLSMNMCAICRPGFSKLVDSLDENESLRVLKVCFNNLAAKNPEVFAEMSPASPSQVPMAEPDPLLNRVQEILSRRDIQVLLWGSRLDN